MNYLHRKLRGNISIRGALVCIGYLLSFIGFFLPWYRVVMSGAVQMYTGYGLASQYSSLWYIYFVPLFAGAGILGSVFYTLGEFRDFPTKWVSVGFSAAILVFILALLFSAAGLVVPLYNAMEIGMYATITGAILSLIYSLF